MKKIIRNGRNPFGFGHAYMSKLISLFLVAVMVFSMIPIAFATTISDEPCEHGKEFASPSTWVEANCTSHGCTLWTCSECGTAWEECGEPVAYGHTVENGLCERCQCVIRDGVSIGELRSFRVDNVYYNAEPDMTWRSWIASDYNTCGAKIIDEVIYNSEENKILIVTLDDVIQGGENLAFQDIPEDVPADNTANYTAGTNVEYVADDEANEWWTVTVPAKLNPGATGYVIAEGQFASNKTLNVTADAEVELTNSINANDKKTLGITFASIALPGDNVAAVTNVTDAAPNGEAISVAAIENALFGTWSGRFNYNVELKQVEISMGLRFNQPYQRVQDGMIQEIVVYEDGSASMWVADAMCSYFPAESCVFTDTTVSLMGKTLSISEDGTKAYDPNDESLTFTLNEVTVGSVQTGTSYNADPNNLLQLGFTCSATVNADDTAIIYLDGETYATASITYGEYAIMASIGEQTMICPIYPDGTKIGIPLESDTELFVFVKDCSHENTSPGDEKDATCTEDGYTGGIVCDDCGKIIEGATIMPALGHNYENNEYICTRCGYENIQNYALTAADYQAKTGIDIFSGDVIIPEYFQDTEDNWYKVTKIESLAFYKCTSLTSIKIPDSVTIIGASAFNDCTSLTNIDIPNSVITIGNLAFDECKSLTSIDIPDSVTGIGMGAFGWSGLTGELVIPSGITDIAMNTFIGCSGLTSVVIPDSVTWVGEYAFQGCSALTNIYYTGTREQWAAITIENDNSRLTSATIHYNYTGE